MKKLIITLITFFSISYITAQVSQNILVEHYTNTRCGTCASKNPPFFTLLEDYDEIHLAYYPSSPFSACVFSIHNKIQADNRTMYYNIFGGTPRVVLNGEVVNIGTPMLQESRIDAEVPNMTPFTIKINQAYESSNSVKVKVTVSTIAMTSLTNLTLHVMLAEKLVTYNAPNGETEHPDVFRKALYGSDGEAFTVANNGDSITFETTYNFDPEWVKEDLEIIAFIQDESDKTVKQAGKSTTLGSQPLGINNLESQNISLFPNPITDILHLQGKLLNNTTVSIYNLLGKKVLQTKLNNSKIDVTELITGIYLLEISIDNKKYYQKINKL